MIWTFEFLGALNKTKKKKKKKCSDSQNCDYLIGSNAISLKTECTCSFDFVYTFRFSSQYSQAEYSATQIVSLGICTLRFLASTHLFRCFACQVFVTCLKHYSISAFKFFLPSYSTGTEFYLLLTFTVFTVQMEQEHALFLTANTVPDIQLGTETMVIE